MRQREGETLGSWYDRICKASAEVEDLTQREEIDAFRIGLEHRELFSDLVKDPVYTVHELYRHAERYIMLEEAMSKRKAESREPAGRGGRGSEKRKSDDRRVEEFKRGRFGDSRTVKPRSYTPLNTSLVNVLNEIERTWLANPRLKEQGRHLGKEADQFCKYHQDNGHPLEKCIALQNEVKRLIQNGQLRSFVDRRPWAVGQNKGRGNTSNAPPRHFGRGMHHGETR